MVDEHTGANRDVVTALVEQYRPTPPPLNKRHYSTDSVVVIHSLKNETSLNGCTAVVVAYSEEIGKYHVKTDTDPSREFMVGGENLRRLSQLELAGRREKASAKHQQNFPTGGHVLIHSLKSISGASLNGHTAVVVAYEKTTGKYHVKTNTEPYREAMLREDNIRRLSQFEMTAREEETTAKRSLFVDGAHVEIHSLLKNVTFNGHTGVITGYDSENDVYTVMTAGVVASFDEVNLRLIHPADVGLDKESASSQESTDGESASSQESTEGDSWGEGSISINVSPPSGLHDDTSQKSSTPQPTVPSHKEKTPELHTPSPQKASKPQPQASKPQQQALKLQQQAAKPQQQKQQNQAPKPDHTAAQETTATPTNPPPHYAHVVSGIAEHAPTHAGAPNGLSQVDVPQPSPSPYSECLLAHFASVRLSASKV